jgi:glycosyltransferase involved in cell wall biosynthesis
MRRFAVAVWHNLPSGGGKRALWQQVEALKRRGHRVKVWSPSTADHKFLDLSQLVDERVLPLSSPKSIPFSKLRSPTHAWRARLDAMTATCDQAAGEMKAAGFEVLLVHGCQDFVIPPMPTQWKGPAALYLQEPDRGLYESRPELPWVTLRPRSTWPFTGTAVVQWRELARIGAAAAYERKTASEFQRVLVNSLFSREAIVRCYGVDASVCYLGVDSAFFRPMGLPREPFVVGVGAAEPHKGISDALRAVAGLPSHLPKQLVWIANKTSSEYASAAQGLAERLGVRLDLRVRLTDDELRQTLNKTGVFLHAATLEPFGLAPLEAMACGTPVVAIAEGGVREFIQHEVTGLLVAERSALAIGKQLSRVLESHELASQLGAAGRTAAVGHWSLDRAADRLESKLLELVD